MIYNTLTREKEAFEPLDPAKKRVTIYNCGPTVYDRFHIGNARNFVVMDIVRRYMEQWLGYEVVFVQNLTDIDDKIINRANEQGRSADDLAKEFAAAYFEDVAKLGVAPATQNPRATEYVNEMIEFMEELEARGLAYASKGSVYFRVRKFAEYGKLSHRNLDEMLEGARVEVNDDKEDPLDFVLWKAAKPGEPKWPSPWGEGRPGWHTECAVMTRELLGETIDIHSGGSDLMFPHHENELAQREGLSAKPFARFWMHNGFLNIDSTKMSKSLGNIRKIGDVLARYRAEIVRFFLLSGHYRHPLDYSEAALDEAAASLKRINEGLETGAGILKIAGVDLNISDVDREANETAKPYIQRFEDGMNDDFNTPRAQAVLHDIVSEIHEERRQKPPDYEKLRSLVSLGYRLRSFFGFEPSVAEGGDAEIDVGVLRVLQGVFQESRNLKLEAVAQSFQTKLSLGEIAALSNGADDLTWSQFGGAEKKGALVELLIEARKLARKQKAYALADSIRNQLAEVGIALEDHPQGTIWKEVQPPAKGG